MRTPTEIALATVVCVAAVHAVLTGTGCTAVIPDGVFACADAEGCPSGFVCHAERCVRPPQGSGGGGGLGDGGWDGALGGGTGDAGSGDAGTGDAGAVDGDGGPGGPVCPSPELQPQACTEDTHCSGGLCLQGVCLARCGDTDGEAITAFVNQFAEDLRVVANVCHGMAEARSVRSVTGEDGCVTHTVYDLGVQLANPLTVRIEAWPLEPFGPPTLQTVLSGLVATQATNGSVHVVPVDPSGRRALVGNLAPSRDGEFISASFDGTTPRRFDVTDPFGAVWLNETQVLFTAQHDGNPTVFWVDVLEEEQPPVAVVTLASSGGVTGSLALLPSRGVLLAGWAVTGTHYIAALRLSEVFPDGAPPEAPHGVAAVASYFQGIRSPFIAAGDRLLTYAGSTPSYVVQRRILGSTPTDLSFEVPLDVMTATHSMRAIAPAGNDHFIIAHAHGTLVVRFP